jgi:hypothetical protein
MITIHTARLAQYHNQRAPLANCTRRCSGSHTCANACTMARFIALPRGSGGAAAAAPALAGYTLVLPALSLGNTCQMAVDLLVNTLLTRSAGAADASCIRRIGFLSTPAVKPVVGSNPWSVPLPQPLPHPGGQGGGGVDAEISMNLEVFTVPSARLAILQQRAGAVAGLHEAVVQAVVEWARASGVAQLVVLSAADAIVMPGVVGGPERRLRFVSSQLEGGAEAAAAVSLRESGIAEWKAPAPVAVAGVAGAGARTPTGAADPGDAADAPTPAAAEPPVQPSWQPPTAAAVAATKTAFADVWGAGCAPVYHRRALTASLPVTTLLLFTSEGDNTLDAAVLALAAAHATGVRGLLAPAASGDAAAAAAAAAVGDAAAVRDASAAQVKASPASALLLPGSLVAPAYWATLFGGGIDQSMYW